MAYVDLNPVRAGLAETPEASDFTSISERIRQWKEGGPAQVPTRAAMTPFVGGHEDEHDTGIPFSFTDYMALMDWIGRAIREDKRGTIPAQLAPILVRLGIEEKQWLPTVKHFGSRFCWAAGRVESMRALGRNIGVSWLKGMGRDRRLGAPSAP